MPPRELVRNEYFRLSAEDEARLMRLDRSPVPFASSDAIEDAFLDIGRGTEGVTAAWALLIDSRDAPARNDPAFEEHFKRVRRPILGRFGRIAVLVKSAAGKLQIARYAREDNLHLTVFDDEAEALAFLRRGDRPSRPSH
jgi:hypothetical protein